MSTADWAAAGRAALRSTVRVRNRLCDGLAVGSGFLLAPGTIITNRHVVADYAGLQVEAWDGTPLQVTAVAESSTEDIAVISVGPADVQPLGLAGGDATGGDIVQAVGVPRGGPMTVSQGRVVGIVDASEYDEPGLVLKATTEIQHGNSGGPLVNAHGQVVGVIFAIDIDSGRALAVPVSGLRAAIAAAGPVRPAACTGAGS